MFTRREKCNLRSRPRVSKYLLASDSTDLYGLQSQNSQPPEPYLPIGLSVSCMLIMVNSLVLQGCGPKVLCLAGPSLRNIERTQKDADFPNPKIQNQRRTLSYGRLLPALCPISVAHCGRIVCLPLVSSRTPRLTKLEVSLRLSRATPALSRFLDVL